MKKLKIILLSCIIASVTGCGGEPPDMYEVYAWANESEVDVKMIAIVENNYPNKGSFTHFEKIVAVGDTLHGHYYEGSGFYGEWYPYLPYETLFEVKAGLIFLDEPKKCLFFDGEVKNDGIDMRSWSSYKEGEQIQSSIETIEYVYTITPELRAMAKEEDCQSSMGE